MKTVWCIIYDTSFYCYRVISYLNRGTNIVYEVSQNKAELKKLCRDMNNNLEPTPLM